MFIGPAVGNKCCSL